MTHERSCYWRILRRIRPVQRAFAGVPERMYDTNYGAYSQMCNKQEPAP